MVEETLLFFSTNRTLPLTRTVTLLSVSRWGTLRWILIRRWLIGLLWCFEPRTPPPRAEPYWALAALLGLELVAPPAITPPVPAAIRPMVRPATARRRRVPARPPAGRARDIAVVLIRSSSSGLGSGRSERSRCATPSSSSLRG